MKDIQRIEKLKKEIQSAKDTLGTVMCDNFGSIGENLRYNLPIKIQKLEQELKELEGEQKMKDIQNEHKVYEGGSDLHLNYDKPNNVDENRWINSKTQKQIEDEYKKNMNIIYDPPFECCKNCPNNYKNNPSGGGVCSCDLPYREMFRW